jgi:hypothetical protein
MTAAILSFPSRPRLRDELERAYDGPLTPAQLSVIRAEECAFADLPPELQIAALIIDEAKVVASWRSIALESLAERRALWRGVCERHRPGQWDAFDHADYLARRHVKFWHSARQMLAKFKAELDAMPAQRAAE